MKLPILCLLAAASASLIAADAPSLTGKWEVYTSIAGNDSNMICSFTQKDADLSGTCDSQRGTVAIAGKVDGSKMNFSYKSEYEGSPLTVAYTGTIQSESRIKGSVEVPEYGVSGDFTANIAK